MSYTSYSPLVTNSPKWEAPLSEDTLMRGAIFAENNAQETQKEIQGSIDNFFKIQAIAPQDEKVLRQRQAEFEQALSGVNISDLSNPNTKAQLNQIVSRFSNDPDILGIAQRSAAVQKEQALQREYELKGKSYVSPLLRQASKYIQGGNYYRDQKFNEQGFVAPDNKDISEWAKSTPEFEKWVKNGAYDDHLKGKAMSSLQSNILQGFKNTPQWQKLHTDNFEQLIDGQDLTSYLDAPSQTVAELFPHLPDSLRPQAEKYISDLQSLKGNPYASSIMKNRLQELYLQDQAYQAAQAYAYTNTIDHKVNDLYKSATDFQEAKDLELYKKQLYAGVLPNEGESNRDYMQRLSKEVYKKDLEIAQAKQDIKTQSAKDIEEAKQANRIEILTKKGDKIGIKTDGSKTFSLNDKEVDKKQLIETVGRKDKKAITEIINSNPELFGNSSGVDPAGLFGLEGGVWFTKDIGGTEYANYEADALIGGTKYRIPLSDIQKYVADPTFVPTVFSEDDNYIRPIQGSKDYLENVDKSNTGEQDVVRYTKGDDILEIPLSDHDAIEEALKQGYTKNK